ncbi:MAG: hypothetical protein ACQES9_09530 [Myxococcota bacterium]
MKTTSKIIPFLILSLFASVCASKKRKIKTYQIKGYIKAKFTPPKSKTIKKVQYLRRLQRQAYWQYYDPFIVVRNKISLRDKFALVLVESKKTAKRRKKKNFKYPIKDEDSVEYLGSSFSPPLKILHSKTGLKVYNKLGKKVKIYSVQQQDGEKKKGKPENIAEEAGIIYPLKTKIFAHKDKLKSRLYHLRIKNDKYSKGKVLKVNSPLFTNISNSGYFTIQGLFPGTYTLYLLYDGKIINQQKLKVSRKKRRKNNQINISVKVPLKVLTF